MNRLSSLAAESPLTSPSPRDGRLLSWLLTAIRSPGLVLQVLQARWQLRRCDRLPLSVRLRGKARVEKYGGRIEVGERVRMEGRTIPIEIVAWRGALLQIGEGTYVNYGASLSAHQGLKIGRNCLIGNYAVIMDSDYHDIQDRTRPGEAAPVVIEDDVWVGLRATVLKGVRIGQGSVIGAGAVVTDDIPPHSLAVGVPARVVKKIAPGEA